MYFFFSAAFFFFCVSQIIIFLWSLISLNQLQFIVVLTTSSWWSTNIYMIKLQCWLVIIWLSFWRYFICFFTKNWEPCPFMFDVDIVEGKNSGTFEDAESSMTQLESLFNWYCAWGLKISNFLFRHKRITLFLCIIFL